MSLVSETVLNLPLCHCEIHLSDVSLSVMSCALFVLGSEPRIYLHPRTRLWPQKLDGHQVFLLFNTSP